MNCEVCKNKIENGVVNDYVLVDGEGYDAYYEHHSSKSYIDSDGSWKDGIADVYVCDDCTIDNCHDIDVPDYINACDTRSWLIEMLRVENEVVDRCLADRLIDECAKGFHKSHLSFWLVLFVLTFNVSVGVYMIISDIINFIF